MKDAKIRHAIQTLFEGFAVDGRTSSVVTVRAGQLKREPLRCGYFFFFLLLQMVGLRAVAKQRDGH